MKVKRCPSSRLRNMAKGTQLGKNSWAIGALVGFWPCSPPRQSVSPSRQSSPPPPCTGRKTKAQKKYDNSGYSPLLIILMFLNSTVYWKQSRALSVSSPSLGVSWLYFLLNYTQIPQSGTQRSPGYSFTFKLYLLYYNRAALPILAHPFLCWLEGE